MCSIRSLLLHVDSSPQSEQRLTLARQLATRLDARVKAVYASTPTALSLPLVMSQRIEQMLPMLEQLDRECRDKARSMFERAEAGATRPIEWSELHSRGVISGMAARAYCTDLLVLGQHDPNDSSIIGVPADFVPSLLMASGRPALIVPHVNIAATLGQRVLIAWKQTRESAHALSAAIPLLRESQHIHLAMDHDHGSPDAQASALEHYLRLHGIRAPIERRAPVAANSPGDGLLSLAAEIDADMLVMGCYGHSRARELVLGGASRTVLGSMTLPVLMAH